MKAVELRAAKLVTSVGDIEQFNSGAVTMNCQNRMMHFSDLKAAEDLHVSIGLLLKSLRDLLEK